MSVDQQQLLPWSGIKSDARENPGEVKKVLEKNWQQLVDTLASRGERPCLRRGSRTKRTYLSFTQTLSSIQIRLILV